MPTLTDLLRYLYHKPQHIVIDFLAAIFSKPLDLSGINNALIISPHPDDEVFGCGGLIMELSSRSKNIQILFLSKGEGTAPDESLQQEFVKNRHLLSIKANTALGLKADRIRYLDFPDGKFGEVSDSDLKKLEESIISSEYDCVFFPHHWEGSPDHDFASGVVNRILKTHNISGYEYCVWLWHHMPLYKAFMLNYTRSFTLPISDLARKTEAIDTYAGAVDEKGRYFSGKLPKMFLKAIGRNKELYFRV